MERDPLVRGLLLMLAAIGTVWLAGWVWQVASRFSDVILLFFLAWLVAFVLKPIARRLQRLGLPLLLAVGSVYLGLALIVVATAVVVVPIAVTQLAQLGNSLPLLGAELKLRADQVHVSLLERGLPEAQLADLYNTAVSRAEAAGAALLASSLTLATALISSVLKAMLVLILSFYIMLDGETIARLFVELLPARYRDDATAALEQIDRTFGGFMRGQLFQAAVYGLGTALVMELSRLPYTLVISIFAGIAMLIPFIGPYLAMIPPFVLAITLAPGAVWWTMALLIVLQFVVVNVLAPRIMSRTVGIHPLVVFGAVLVGAKVAGAWGAIFGVPAAAMLFLLLRVLYLRVVLRTPLYRAGAPLSPEALVPAARAMVPHARVPAVPAPGSDRPELAAHGAQEGFHSDPYASQPGEASARPAEREPVLR